MRARKWQPFRHCEKEMKIFPTCFKSINESTQNWWESIALVARLEAQRNQFTFLYPRSVTRGNDQFVSINFAFVLDAKFLIHFNYYFSLCTAVTFPSCLRPRTISSAIPFSTLRHWNLFFRERIFLFFCEKFFSKGNCTNTCVVVVCFQGF